MSGRPIRIALTVAVTLLLAGAPRANAQTADDLSAARRLVGMWRLVDRTVSFADGTSRPDPRTTAYIFYSDTGMTCYIAMDPTRGKWKSEAAPTPDEAVASIAGLGAY